MRQRMSAERRAAAWLAGVSLAVTLVHLSFAGRYGFFRDELYFIACGARPAWGYVDQPPLTPIAAWAWDVLVQGSLFGFRIVPALGAGVLAWLAGSVAKQLGGGAWSRALAALSVSVAPMFLVATHLFTVNLLEPIAWTLLALLVLRQLENESPGRWLAIGLCAGLALLNKYSVGFWLLALLVGLVATRERHVLGSRWVLAAAALALALVAPNVAWQASRGFPFLDLLRAGQASKNVPFEALTFSKEVMLGLHPITMPLWVLGLWLSWRQQRWLALAVLAFVSAMFALKAKPYYAAPAFVVPIAAGAVALERWVIRLPARAALLGVVLAAGAVTAPLVVPVLPIERMLAYQRALGHTPPPLENKEYGELPQHLADQFGWPEIGAALADAWRTLPEPERARAAVFTFNYGDAAAGARFGHVPTISGHNQYGEWGPAPADGTVVIVFGGTQAELARYFGSVTRIGTGPTSPLMMPYERRRPLWVVREPKLPLDELWPRLLHID